MIRKKKIVAKILWLVYTTTAINSVENNIDKFRKHAKIKKK